ncbi:carotenoid 1,2-hydratase [Paracrocinitomix mangrovi]|uniref:carotenoid 1,2-hydratase n=1 Tax=Paracrocinitomix mangrovi TaxID=2862509 RepID=UPI001C8D6D0C|nr:carotenoid 1,2-hydratase [Paracrocinitomix mangrovi]UKN00266.1 carotenoid 1,2-hydratase [Paracrocinitomix mangrovi]
MNPSKNQTTAIILRFNLLRFIALIFLLLLPFIVLPQKKNIVYTSGKGDPHKSFEEEFLSHKKCSEWWYVTGYLEDQNKQLYTFQFTLANINVKGIKIHMILISITDLQNGEHYYFQDHVSRGKHIVTTQNETTYGTLAGIKYAANDKSSFGKMNLSIKKDSLALDLQMEAQKSPVWHCDNGKLQMGILDDPKQYTYYFSLTNILAEGKLTLNGKELTVTGKAWFDKQGGPYTITNPRTNWEWFSFRFFDNEEIMLFYFPKDEHHDCTYIKENGTYERLQNFNVIPLDTITEPSTDYIFTYGWKVKIPGYKDENYTLKPKVDGQFNVFFYELIADVYNSKNEIVGYCYVELLPGARNKKLKNNLVFK